MKYDTIVIGGGLCAAIYSYCNNLPLLYINEYQNIPFAFEFYNLREDLSQFFIKKERHEFVLRNKKIKSFGIQKRNFYERLIFFLSLGGLVPFTSRISSIMIMEDHLLVSMEYKSLKVYFNKLIIFDDEGIIGLEVEKLNENPLYQVVDWLNIGCGQLHEYDLFENNNDFIKQLFFYASERIEGNLSRKKIMKDAVSISYLTKEQLNDQNYSTIIAKLKVEKMMKEAGIHGKSNGLTMKKKLGIKVPYFLSLKVSHAEREIRKIDRHLYKECDNIKYKFNVKDEDLLKEYKNKEIESYIHSLNKKIHG
jgi:hypothetical protein